MSPDRKSRIAELLGRHEKELVRAWIDRQLASAATRHDPISEGELREQSSQFLRHLRDAAIAAGTDDLEGSQWDALRELLGEISRSRARLGFTPAETAMFVFSLKEPLFTLLRRELGSDASAVAEETWNATVLLDRLGLYTTDLHQRGREQIIVRQQQEMMELSTPVVQLWEGVLGLPLIGTLDSARTQVVMESLLQRIVDTGARVAIIDITGVPTVDTLVAQHLLKTVAAARLMGADCIISGIRPQIAQTVVHLGLDLSTVVTKATLADAFAVALQRVGLSVVRAAAPR
jgi:rsbT co-antagonist protein RsbR